MSELVAATSTASLMAIPSEPGDSGSCSRIRFPDWVVGEGEGRTSAPKVSMNTLRYGFWLYEALTMNTRQSRPKNCAASDSADPHWPAPVSVAIRRTPASLL